MHFPISPYRMYELLAVALTNSMCGAVLFYRECEGCTFSGIKQTAVTKVFCWEIRCIPSNLHIPFCTAFASEYVFVLYKVFVNGPRVSIWFFGPCVS